MSAKEKKVREKSVKSAKMREGRNGGKLKSGGVDPKKQTGRPTGKSKKTIINELIDLDISLSGKGRLVKKFRELATAFRIENPSAFQLATIGQVVSAIMGDSKAYKNIIEFTDGKAIQQIDLNPNEPMQLKIILEDGNPFKK